MPSIGLLIAGAYFVVFALAFLWNVMTTGIAAISARFRAGHMSDEAQEGDPEIVVTLVHGTWARRATWTMTGSELRSTLSRAANAPVAFQPFVWSGRNSISARRRAVKDLTEHLRKAIEQAPKAAHYIVAHSHGGNIAFQALADPLLNCRIAGLVCLSTPFLTITRRELGPVGRTALWWLPVVFVFYGGVFAIERLSPSSGDTLGPVLLVASVAVGFLSAHLLNRFATSVSESLTHPTVDPSKVLIVRAAGDEASAALGAVHIISWLSGRLWLLTSQSIGATVDTVEHWRTVLIRQRVTTALLAGALGIVLTSPLFAPPAPDVMWAWRMVFLAGAALSLIFAILVRGGLVAAFLGRIMLAVIAAPFLTLIATLGLALGPELLAAGLLYQVTAEATPPGRWVVWQIPSSADDSSSTGLMHSASYQNPKALELLEAWFAAAAQQHRSIMPIPS